MTRLPEKEKADMTAQNSKTIVSQAGPDSVQKLTAVAKQILQYTIYAGVGSLGAGVSVAVVMGLALIGVLLQSPYAVVFPDMRLLSGVAVLTSLGVSWLLNRLARRLLPHLFGQANRQALPIILAVGLLTASITEPFIFGQGF